MISYRQTTFVFFSREGRNKEGQVYVAVKPSIKDSEPVCSKAYSLIRGLVKQELYMSIKPRNFDKHMETQLVQQGICTQKTLDKYSNKEKRYFFNMIYIGAVGRRKHPSDESAFSLFSNERRKYIPKASRFEELKTDIPLLQKITSYWAGNWSDGYIITKAGYNVFSNSCKAVVRTGGLEDENNRPYNPPRNGIRSILKDGKKCHVKECVPTEIVINEFSLRRLMEHLKQQSNSEHIISQIQLILATATANRSGCLPTTYVQSPGGRFYAEGPLNLQNCSRIIRIAALIDHYDIDIENCHYTLLAQMCERLRVSTPYINHYIQNKKSVRADVAEFFNCSEKMSKEILIALIYGSNLSRYGILSKLDLNLDNVTIHGSWIDNLYKEIVKVRKNVIKDYTNRTPGHFKIKNEAGMTKVTKTDKIMNAKHSTLLAHILHGAESLILQHMIRFLGDDIVLLQHDGVTCHKSVNTAELSDYIAEKTGYRVKFDLEKLALNFGCDNFGLQQPIDHEELNEVYAA